MSRSFRVTFLAIVLLPITAAFAQDAPKIDQAKALEKIKADALVAMKQFYVPGASIAIVKDDKVILATGLGYKDLKNKKPVSADTLFAIGSCSKAFTSMLMAMAVDEDKVKWTDNPNKYLPYFRMQDPDTNAKITINDILSHRTGLPRTDLILVGGESLTPEDMIYSVTRAKPTGKLGEKWQYQNIMFVAAGEIEHTVYGKPWQQLVKERIFDPLGMVRTNTSVPETLKDADHSLGYDASPAMHELPMRAIDPAAPAGAINSSANEMSQWVRYLLDGGVVNGKRLVRQESFDEIFKPHQTIIGDTKYGYGWMLHAWHGHKLIEHGGNIDGFNAQVALMPDQHLGFVMLTNVSGSGLPQVAMESVFKNLVGVPADAEQIVALKDADQEVGVYHNDQLKMDLKVTHEGDKLFVQPTAQPKLDLLPLGNRKYKIAPPAPDKVYVTFGPDKDDAKVTVATLEQSGMKLVFKPAKPYESPMPAAQILDKETAWLGGADNMAKIAGVSYRYTYDMESQGCKEVGEVKKQVPNKEDVVAIFVTNAGRRFAWDDTSFDGTKGIDKSSFSQDTVYEGAQLADISLLATTFQEMNWRALFPMVKVTGEEKVEGTDCYVVEKHPKVGSKVTDYVSKSDFALVKRIMGVGPSSVTDVYKDWQTIEGVKFPASLIRETLPGSKGPVTFEELSVSKKS